MHVGPVRNLALVMLVGGLIVVPVSGQQPSQGQPGQRREGRRDRQRDSGPDAQRSDRGNAPWGRGGRGPGQFTPQDREQFYNRMVDRHIERLTRNYQLSDEQQVQARAQLEQLKVEQRAYSESRRQASAQAGQNRQQGGPGGAPRAPGADGRRGPGRDFFSRGAGGAGGGDSFWQNAPLFNTQRVAGEVEKLLPPEQAAEGRARLEREEAEIARRREEVRQQAEQWQAQGGDPGEFWRAQRERWQQERGGNGPATPDAGAEQAPVAPQAPDVNAAPAPGGPDAQAPVPDGSRESRRNEARRRSGDRRSDRESPREAQPTQTEQPVAASSWEQYVSGFIRRYRLDASQQASAHSILREMQGRRAAYEQSRRLDFNLARQIENAGQREQELASLGRPISEMFDELKSRLDELPTTDQRSAAGDVAPSTQPAATPTSQPAIATTQPVNATTQPSEQGRRSIRDRGTREERRPPDRSSGRRSRRG